MWVHGYVSVWVSGCIVLLASRSHAHRPALASTHSTHPLQVHLVSSDEAVALTFTPDCRFASLNEMTAGQEDVDEVINRDINRTFPEHPFFGLADGQQALFRVLKAYSLHDLEVGGRGGDG